MTRFAVLATLVLVAAVMCGVAPAGAQKTVDRVSGQERNDALKALDDTTNAVGRMGALRTLATEGTMADLPRIAQALRDPAPGVRVMADGTMWAVWSRSGDPAIDALFANGVEALQEGRWPDAVRTFSAIIAKKPEFAEGWNKRATAYYLMGEYQKSLADCDEVVKRNPLHYGALSGYGMIYIQLDQPARALEYYERALDVNPNLDGVRNAIENIRDFLIRKRRESI